MSLQKLFELAEIEGYDTPGEMLRNMGDGSVVPGICTNPDCSFTARVEPDQGTGWCEQCKSNTVKSFLRLLGFI